MTFFRPICHERSWLTGCERHEVATPKRRMVPRANQQRRCRKPFAKCKPNTIWKALSKLLFFISEGWRFFGARVERIHWPIRFDWDAKQLKKALAFGRSRGNCKKNSSFSLWPLNLDIFFFAGSNQRPNFWVCQSSHKLPPGQWKANYFGRVGAAADRAGQASSAQDIDW